MTKEKHYVMSELKSQLIDELVERWGEISEHKYPEDLIDELVDSYVPIYNWELLEYAQDDIDLAICVPEALAFDGSNNAINIIAGNIYECLRGIAFNEFYVRREEEKKEKK
jgi:hypothetical protein